jgi:uncharacterized OB-fold protein
MPHTLTELVMGTAPTVIEETRGFWEGTLAEELRVQVCRACGTRQLPGGPCCTTCLSQDLAWERASGRGTVFSFTIVRHAFHPAFANQVPYVVADIELEEGPIITSRVEGVPVEEVRIGMPVEVFFDAEIEDAFHNRLRLPKFRPARGATT